MATAPPTYRADLDRSLSWEEGDQNFRGLYEGKVDKVVGKGLSTNDFDDAAETKLAGIATGATANATDAHLLARANHTGVQAISTITDLQATLDIKADLVAGKVPAGQLPSYVDDVIEVTDFASLPATGEAGKIYVLLTPYTVTGPPAITSSQFRWTGTVYAPIVASPGTTDAVTEGSTNLYFTGARAIAALLTGLSVAVGGPVVAGDSVVIGIGKLQKEISDLWTAIGLRVVRTSATGSAIIPSGTTAQRDPSPTYGAQRANNTLNGMEWWNGTSWTSMGGGASGGTDNAAFYEADKTISQSYTIGASAYKSGVTFTIASPAVCGYVGHGLVEDQAVHLRTTGALPTGLAVDTEYFVIAAGLGADTFSLSATLGGAAINTSGSQSGVHSIGKIKNAFSPGPVTGANGVIVIGENGTTWTGT